MVQNGLARVFDNLYKQFSEDNDEPEHVDKVSYLQSKRLIAMVDRREQAKGIDSDVSDTIFMYDPPEDCRHFPKVDPVPEWFMASSRTCLLPCLNVC